MHKRIKICLGIMIGMFILSGCNNNQSDVKRDSTTEEVTTESIDFLAKYRDKLDEINSEYGTKFQIDAHPGDDDYDEAVDFFSSMSMEEFEKYIKKFITDDNYKRANGDIANNLPVKSDDDKIVEKITPTNLDE